MHIGHIKQNSSRRRRGQLSMMKPHTSPRVLGIDKPSDLLESIGLDNDGVAMCTRDSPGEVQILLHEGDSSCVDRTKVCILIDSKDEGLCACLNSIESLALVAHLTNDALTDLSHQSLEWSFRDQGSSVLLILLDLPQCNCACSESSF